MRDILTTLGELVGIAAVTAGTYIVFGLGCALIFAGIAIGFISYWIGRDV